MTCFGDFAPLNVCLPEGPDVGAIRSVGNSAIGKALALSGHCGSEPFVSRLRSVLEGISKKSVDA